MVRVSFLDTSVRILRVWPIGGDIGKQSILGLWIWPLHTGSVDTTPRWGYWQAEHTGSVDMTPRGDIGPCTLGL